MNNSPELEEILNQGYRYAIVLTKNKDLAFDLVQDSYLKTLEVNAPLQLPYFIKVIKNKFLDAQRRKQVKKKWMEKSTVQLSVLQPNGVEPYLEKVINELPIKQREILILSVVEGFTAQEISDLMEIPRGTVLSILKRTKDKLRTQLNEQKT